MTAHKLMTPAAAWFASGRRRWFAGAAVLFLIFCWRIVALYQTQSDTYDEHAHISEPLRWLETGEYLADGFHSPLARLAIAAGPRLAGLSLRMPWFFSNWDEQDIQEYWRGLFLARMGALPFAALLFWLVALWPRITGWERGGLASAALLSLSPTVIGHSSLAALDVPGAAGFMVALAGLWGWMQRPTLTRAFLAGAAAGFAQMTKFSALGFLAAPVLFALASVAIRKSAAPRAIASQALVAVIGAGLVIWASYGFDVGPIHSHRHGRATGTPEELRIGAVLQGVTTPAPAFWRGFVDLAYLQQLGHPASFLGEAKSDGWWSYFPVALVLKASPAMILLSLWGLVLAVRRSREGDRSGLFLACAAAGVFLVSMPSHVNIGVRHVMPVFPIMALLGGAVVAAYRRPSAPWLAAVALLLWHAAESVMAHPHYIAYFTPAARERDYRYLSDSNLAWGQDRTRLAEWLEKHPEKAVHVIGGEGIGILRKVTWANGPEDAEHLVMDTNVASIILSGNPEDRFAPVVRSKPCGRIGRSYLIFCRSGEGSR